MTRKIENEITVRDNLIAGLEKEIKIQDKIIKEQKIMIKTLEEQNSELMKLRRWCRNF